MAESCRVNRFEAGGTCNGLPCVIARPVTRNLRRARHACPPYVDAPNRAAAEMTAADDTHVNRCRECAVIDANTEANAVHVCCVYMRERNILPKGYCTAASSSSICNGASDAGERNWRRKGKRYTFTLQLRTAVGAIEQAPATALHNRHCTQRTPRRVSVSAQSAGAVRRTVHARQAPCSEPAATTLLSIGTPIPPPARAPRQRHRQRSRHSCDDRACAPSLRSGSATNVGALRHTADRPCPGNHRAPIDGCPSDVNHACEAARGEGVEALCVPLGPAAALRLLAQLP